MDIRKIEEEIVKQGERLLDCPHACNGSDILWNKETGHIPRCLHFEKHERDSEALGMVIDGTNPGQALENELFDYTSWHKEGNLTYQNVVSRIVNGGYDKVGQKLGITSIFFLLETPDIIKGRSQPRADRLIIDPKCNSDALVLLHGAFASPPRSTISLMCL
ncbi:hypothetical protein [Neobacillus terrae]|uniref:hypothetical protein n=1 Tax=Neobacillus terrae TaxID=3034837 RepID=UPI001407DDBA|nr:hypothetical protein [Neobacillus terrae]NHM32483.1 hypothetical protein [Neobacillus terrae]